MLTSAWKATLDVGGVEVEGLGGLGVRRRAGGPVPRRGHPPLRARRGPALRPEVWWALYRAYKPEKAALLEPRRPERAPGRARSRRSATTASRSGTWPWSKRPRATRACASSTSSRHACPDGARGARPRLRRRRAERAAARAARSGSPASTSPSRQLELARPPFRRPPSCRPACSRSELPPASFDAVVALYSMAHLPRERHAALLARIAGWLRPGGLFLASLGAGDRAGRGRGRLARRADVLLVRRPPPTNRRAAPRAAGFDAARTTSSCRCAKAAAPPPPSSGSSRPRRLGREGGGSLGARRGAS